MQSAQFYKGMINGVEISYETPDLLQFISRNKLNELWDREKLGEYHRVYWSERIVAKTVIKKSEPDEMGRVGIVNHTVFYKFDPYVEKDGLKYLFDTDTFQRRANQGEFNFKMPPAPELKQPLEAPPPMEVEP